MVLGIASDGSYRVMPPLEKVFFAGKLIYCEPFDPDQGVVFVAVYRDNMKIAYAKRFKIEKFIRNKEYQLIKGEKGKLDLLIPPESAGVLALTFKPAPRQRVKGGKFDLGELELTSPTSRGRPYRSSRTSGASRARRRPRRRNPQSRPSSSAWTGSSVPAGRMRN